MTPIFYLSRRFLATSQNEKHTLRTSFAPFAVVRQDKLQALKAFSKDSSSITETLPYGIFRGASLPLAVEEPSQVRGLYNFLRRSETRIAQKGDICHSVFVLRFPKSRCDAAIALTGSLKEKEKKKVEEEHLKC